MRRLALALTLVLASAASAFAYDTPKALLEALYFPYFQGYDYDWSDWHQTDFRSKALNALFEKDAAETPDDEIGRIDFDPYINAQDYEITDFAIGDARINGDAASVEVKFKNFDDPQDIMFSLVNEDGGWKIDDVESKVDPTYKLTELLTAPWPQ
jgi:hypothetical protein